MVQSQVQLDMKYGNKDELCFCDIVDDSCYNKDKKTILYFIEPKNFNRIQRKLRSISGLDATSAGDLMVDIYEELVRKEDYQLTFDKKDNKIIPLEGYVANIVTVCIKRHFSRESKRNKLMASNVVQSSSSDDEESIFNFIADSKNEKEFSQFDSDLESSINWARHHRYQGSCDILAVIYSKLVSNNETSFKLLLKLLNIDSTTENKLEEYIYRTDEAMQLLKHVMREKERSIKLIEQYVYGAKTLKRVLANSTK